MVNFLESLSYDTQTLVNGSKYSAIDPHLSSAFCNPLVSNVGLHNLRVCDLYKRIQTFRTTLVSCGSFGQYNGLVFRSLESICIGIVLFAKWIEESLLQSSKG